MTDTVLQSFCERCGTRYTFTEQGQKPEAGRAKLGRLGRRASAELPAEPTISTALPSSERFDGTFHFCLECRQYACLDCWNSDAGYCVGCRPPGAVSDEAVRAPSAAIANATDAPGEPPAASTAEPSAWPTGDLERQHSGGMDAHDHGHAPGLPDPGPDPSITSTDDDAVPEPARRDEQRTIFERPDEAVDEWGRPITEQPKRRDGLVVPDLPFGTSQPAADPWQDLVFSERGERPQAAPSKPVGPRIDPPIEHAVAPAVAPAPPAEPERPADDPSELAEPESARPPTVQPTPPAPSAWPEADRERSPATASAQAVSSWPDADRKDESLADKPGASPARPEADGVVGPATGAVENGPADSSVMHASAATASEGIGSTATDTTLETTAEQEEESAQAVHEAVPPGVDEVAPVLDEEAVEPQEPEEESLSAAHRILGPGAVATGAIYAGVDPSIVSEPLDAALSTPATAAPLTPSPTASPLRPLPTPPTYLAPGPTASGPFAEPYLRPADRSPVPAPPPPPSRDVTASPGVPPAGATLLQASTSPPPLPPGPPAGQSGYPPPPSSDAWAPPSAPPPDQPPMRPPALPRPSFMPPPPGAVVPPNLPPLPSAAKRTASQGCTSCGLPLSAKARYCRRCGAAQP